LIAETKMLSVQKVKRLLNGETISDEKAEKIRDECRDLAEIIFDKWLEEKRLKNKE
jgi:hypothetical protein